MNVDVGKTGASVVGQGPNVPQGALYNALAGLMVPNSIGYEVNPNLTQRYSRQVGTMLDECEASLSSMAIGSGDPIDHLAIHQSTLNTTHGMLTNLLLQLSEETGNSAVISPYQEQVLHRFLLVLFMYHSIQMGYTMTASTENTMVNLWDRILQDMPTVRNLFTNLVSPVTDAIGFTVQLSNVSPSQLVGAGDYFALVQSVLRNDFSSLQTGSPLFVIMAGPPGSGKSFTARGLASTFSEGRYIQFNMSSLSAKYVGEAEKQLDQLFTSFSRPDTAHMTVIFDEADIIFSDGPGVAPHHRSIANLIQTALDGTFHGNLLLIFTTNYLSRFSDAMRRRTRFPMYIEMPSFARQIKGEILRQLNHPCSMAIVSNPAVILSEAYQSTIVETFYRYGQSDKVQFTVKNVYDTLNLSRALSVLERDQALFTAQHDVYGHVLLHGRQEWLVAEAPTTGSNSALHSVALAPDQTLSQRLAQTGQVVFVLPSASALEKALTFSNALSVEQIDSYREDFLLTNKRASARGR